MRIIGKVAVVDEEKCSACGTCVKICPVEAIVLEKHSDRGVAVIDEQKCYDCTLCMTRCPEYAVTMVERDSPLRVGVDMAHVPKEAVDKICEAAHMYPDQVICYCHRVQAKEVAASILLGAKTPEAIARATGARTGCGVLCITSMIRLLDSAGVEMTQAPGYQWYATDISIWNVSKTLREKYPQYYLDEDLRCMNNLFPGETLEK